MQVASDLQRVDVALKTKRKNCLALCTMKSAASWSARLTKRYLHCKIKDDEVGGACGTNGGEEKFFESFYGET